MKPDGIFPKSLTETAGPSELKNYLRRWARRQVSVPAKVEIVLAASGKTYTSGHAVVHNVSLSGALLGQIVLKKAALPVRRFKIHLTFQLQDYRGVGAIARPIHFGRDPKKFELGVEFEDLWIRAPEE